jgi:hypothetical protein
MHALQHAPALFTFALLGSLPLGPGSAQQRDEVTTLAQDHGGWIDLIGADLDEHWRQVNCAASTFRLEPDPDDASARMIHCTGKPTGVLRTVERFENFVVEFEWRHMTKGWGANAGFFLWSDPWPAQGVPFTRSVEVQVANFDENSNWYTRHGDVFPIHGARMDPDPRFGRWQGGSRSLPLEFRARGTGEWNHYRITCIDGTVQLELNGRLVSGGYHAAPRSGYLCLESEGGEVHFRGLRLLPLAPDARGLAAEEFAQELEPATRVRPLYDGLGLDGWQASRDGAFVARDWILAGVSAGTLGRELPDGDLDLRLDWRHPEAEGSAALPPSDELPLSIGSLHWSGPVAPRGSWNRLLLERRGTVWRARLNGVAQSERTAAGERLELRVGTLPVEFASVLLATSE